MQHDTECLCRMLCVSSCVNSFSSIVQQEKLVIMISNAHVESAMLIRSGVELQSVVWFALRVRTE